MRSTSDRSVARATRAARGLATALVMVLVATHIAIPAATPAAATTCMDAGRGSSHYGGGTGEAGDPYRIATVANLEAIRERVDQHSESQAGCFFIQTADLDLSGIASWVAIGSSRTFEGHFDGGFRTIGNLTIAGGPFTSSSPVYFGLFGQVSGGSVTNVRLVGVSIDLEFDAASSSSIYIGALISLMPSVKAPGETLVERSTAQGSITVTFRGGSGLYAGGLVGRSRRNARVEDRNAFIGTIDATIGNASTSTSGRDMNVGGLVGRTSSNSTLSRGYVSADITVRVEEPAETESERSHDIGMLTGSTSGNASALSELYAVGSLDVSRVGGWTETDDATVRSGVFGLIEDPDDTFTDIYYLDTLGDFAGGQVSGFDPDDGLGNVTALTDAQMRGVQPATRMVGTGTGAADRWRYANGPSPVSGGEWFLVLDPVPGGYPYPVFTWEVEEVPAGTSIISRTVFTVPPAADPVPASGPVLSCDPNDAAVGVTVTCTVTGGDAGINILWGATAGADVIASTGVRLDSDGIGTFSFVVPVSALGLPIGVELVAWTSPIAVGVAGGPVPSTVPAGQGPALPAVIVLLLGVLGLVTLVSGVLAPRSR